MHSDESGFASAEFIFVTLIVLLLMGGMISIIGSTQDKTQSGEFGITRVMGEKIAGTINTVYINGNGYSIVLDLASSTNFNASIASSGYLTLSSNGQNVDIKILPARFNDSYTLLSGNKYRVKNDNGTISITLI